MKKIGFALLVLTFFSCNQKKEKLVKELTDLWIYKGLQENLKIKYDKENGFSFQKNKTLSHAVNFVNIRNNEELLQKYLQFHLQGMFIKFNKNGTFYQRFPFVYFHGTWKLNSDNLNQILLELNDGSKGVIEIDRFTEDSLFAKCKFELSKTSTLSKNIFAEITGKTIVFERNWYTYSDNLPDPFLPIYNQWNTIPIKPLTDNEIAEKVANMFDFLSVLLRHEEKFEHPESRIPTNPEEFIRYSRLSSWFNSKFERKNVYNYFFDSTGYVKSQNIISRAYLAQNHKVLKDKKKWEIFAMQRDWILKNK